MNEEELMALYGGLLAPRYPVASLGAASGASNLNAQDAAQGWAGQMGFNIDDRGGLLLRPWEQRSWELAGIDPNLWDANLPGGGYGGGYYGGGGLLGPGAGLGGLTPEQIAAITRGGGTGLPKNWQEYLDWVKNKGSSTTDDDDDADDDDDGTGKKKKKKVVTEEDDVYTPPEFSFLPNQREYTDHQDWYMNVPYESHHVGTHEAALRRIYESEGGDRLFGDYDNWFFATKPEREVMVNQQLSKQFIPPVTSMGAGLLGGHVPGATSVPQTNLFPGLQEQGLGGGGGPSASDLAAIAARDQAAENERRAQENADRVANTFVAPVVKEFARPTVGSAADVRWNPQDAIDAHNALFPKGKGGYAGMPIGLLGPR